MSSNGPITAHSNVKFEIQLPAQQRFKEKKHGVCIKMKASKTCLDLVDLRLKTQKT